MKQSNAKENLGSKFRNKNQHLVRKMSEVSFLWHLLNVNPLLCGGSRRRLKASKMYSHVN